MKRLLGMISVASLLAATSARGTEARGELVGGIHLKGLHVISLSLRTGTRKVTATLGDSPCIIVIPVPPAPTPVDPETPRAGCNKYRFVFDLADPADAASYQMLLAAQGGCDCCGGSCPYETSSSLTSYVPGCRGRVNVSLDPKGQITELSVGRNGSCPCPCPPAPAPGPDLR